MEITNMEKNGDIPNASRYVEAAPEQETPKRGRGRRLRNKDTRKEEDVTIITNCDGMPFVKKHIDIPIVQGGNGARLEADRVDIINKEEKENENTDQVQYSAYQNGSTVVKGDIVNGNDADDPDVDIETVEQPVPSMSSPPFDSDQQLGRVPGERVRRSNTYVTVSQPSTGKRGRKPAPPVDNVFQTPSDLRTQARVLQSQVESSTSIAPKRVLPTRQRRGGPGVGSCHVDLLIMETEKRAKESRPVVPFTQKFFLSTNAQSLPAPEGGESSTAASTSYFEKPEVKAAYLAQKAIQVPEFWPLPNDAVGGRLRARQDEEGFETSDVAYINRHRKYESFEKRQRRREKEKLVHEQYKLKERIEQLKGMDVSAFGPGGEARRREMLDVAIGLESRYAILLPPEPKKIIHKKGDNRRGRSVGARAGTTTGGEEGESDEEEFVSGPQALSRLSRPPEKARPERGKKKEDQEYRPEREVDIKPRRPTTPAEPRTQAVTVALQATVVPNEMRRASGVFGAPFTRRGRSATVAAVSAPPVFMSPRTTTPVASVVPYTAASTSAAIRSMIYDTTSEGSPDPIDAFSSAPSRKRRRLDSLQPSTPEPMFTQSVLLQIAARKAAQPTARQTGRSLTAFGFRIPPEVEEVLPTYVLPDWLITQEELDRHYTERQERLLQQQQPQQKPEGEESV